MRQVSRTRYTYCVSQNEWTPWFSGLLVFRLLLNESQMRVSLLNPGKLANRRKLLIVPQRADPTGPGAGTHFTGKPTYSDPNRAFDGTGM